MENTLRVSVILPRQTNLGPVGLVEESIDNVLKTGVADLQVVDRRRAFVGTRDPGEDRVVDLLEENIALEDSLGVGGLDIVTSNL